MANMSYCRFRNTYADFVDCLHALKEEPHDISPEELEYVKMLAGKAQRFLEAYEEAKEIIEEHLDEDE